MIKDLCQSSERERMIVLMHRKIKAFDVANMCLISLWSLRPYVPASFLLLVDAISVLETRCLDS